MAVCKMFGKMLYKRIIYWAYTGHWMIDFSSFAGGNSMLPFGPNCPRLALLFSFWLRIPKINVA
uniref:Uncharacterized protein n=1 Tax=Arundo donax TaxID=35708 RepID=A0A0A9D4W0_ARUDO